MHIHVTPKCPISVVESCSVFTEGTENRRQSKILRWTASSAEAGQYHNYFHTQAGKRTNSEGEGVLPSKAQYKLYTLLP